MRKVRLFLGLGFGGILALSVAFVALVLSQPVASGTVRQIQLTSELLPLKRSDPGQSRVGRLRFMGAIALKSGDREFGGVSGIVWESECKRLLGVSDTGLWIVLEPQEQDGRLIGVTAGWVAPILDMQGRKPTDKVAADSEELARTADGDVWVFYEQTHRAERFHGLTGCDPQSLTQKPVEQRVFVPTANWQPNAGMEAATADGQSLLVISEQMPVADDDRQAFVAAPGGKISTFAWVPPENFDPTAMDLMHDAAGKPHIVVLHRRFSPLRGLAAIITEAPLNMPPDARIEGTDVAILIPPYTIDNMEGLAIRHEDGRNYVYLVSDNNFNFFQKTLLMKFELLPAGKDGK